MNELDEVRFPDDDPIDEDTDLVEEALQREKSENAA